MEIGEVDLWATVERQKAAAAQQVKDIPRDNGAPSIAGGDEQWVREPGKGQAFQGYIERDEAVERAAKGDPLEKDKIAFSFGTIGETPEDRAAFWEKVETHLPGQRAQYKMILELPHEASSQTRLNIMLDFTKQMFRDREIPFWCALHSPIPGVNDPRNYHAHIVYIGRPAKIIDHHEKVTFTRKKQEVREGAPIKEWDFAAQVIDNRWGMRKLTYPYRRQNDEQLRFEHRMMRPIHRRFARIVNQHMQMAGLSVRYDPNNTSLRKKGKEEFRDLGRNAVELIRGKRSIDKEIMGFRDIFENEVLRSKRDENKLAERITAAELRLKELEKDKNAHWKEGYQFSFQIWQHSKAEVSYARADILRRRLKADREILAEVKDRSVEHALYTALSGAREKSKDKEEIERLDDMISVIKPDIEPGMRLLMQYDRDIRAKAFQYQKWFKVNATPVYDPTLDVAIRTVAVRYGWDIPKKLQMEPPPGVTIHQDRIPRTGYPDKENYPAEIRLEKIHEFSGMVSLPRDPNSLRVFYEKANKADEAVEKALADSAAERERQVKAMRRKALLSKKAKGRAKGFSR